MKVTIKDTLQKTKEKIKAKIKARREAPKAGWTRWAGFGVCLAAALLCLGYAVFMTTHRAAAEDTYAELQAQTHEEASPAPTEAAATPEPEAEPAEEGDLPAVLLEDALAVDFEALAETNGDIYAWIDVPGTGISYPVLQNETDNYYLMRNLDGSYGYPACLFTNAVNPKDFSALNTIIYGHNMRDGTMFAALNEYMDSEYFDQHAQVVVYTPDKILVWRVVMAAYYNNQYIPACYDMDTPEGRDAFLESVAAVAVCGAAPEDLGEDGRVLTLSTCNTNGVSRTLVVAVLEGLGVTE